MAAAASFNPNSPLDAQDRAVAARLAQSAPPSELSLEMAPLDDQDKAIAARASQAAVARPQAPPTVIPPAGEGYRNLGPAAPPQVPQNAPGSPQGGVSVAAGGASFRPQIDPRTGHVIDPSSGVPFFAGHPHYAAQGAGEAPPGPDIGTFFQGAARDVGQVASGEAGATMAGAQAPEPRYQPQVDPQTGRVVDPTTGQPFMPGQPHAAPQRTLAGQALEVATPALAGTQKYAVDPLMRLAALVVNPVHAWLHSGYEEAGREYQQDPAHANIIEGFLRGTLSEQGARAAWAGLTDPNYVQSAPFTAPGFRNVPLLGVKPGTPEDELMRGVLNWLADVPLDILTDHLAAGAAWKPLRQALGALDRASEAHGLQDIPMPLPGGSRSLRQLRVAAADNREIAHMIGAEQGQSGENLRQALVAKLATAKDMNALRQSGVPLFRTTADGRKVNQIDELIYHWVEAGTEGAKYPDRAAVEADARALTGDPKLQDRIVGMIQRNGQNYARVWRQTGERLERVGYLKPGTVAAMGDRYAARMYQSSSHNADDIEAWLQAAHDISQESSGKFGLSERAMQLGNQILGRPGEGGSAANTAKARKIDTFAEREARGGEFQASPIFAKSVPRGERIAERQGVLGRVAERFGTPGYTEEPKPMQRAAYGPEDVAAQQQVVGERESALREAQARQAAVAGQPATPGVAERRQDLARRKAVEEMTPEEMRVALKTDPLTGLGNKRAWEEWHGYDDETGHHPGVWEQNGKKEQIVSADADSLKWVNDNYGHEAGDTLLRAVGDALKKVGLSDDFYHVSGDEFYGHTANPADADARLKAADEWLRQHTIYVKVKDPQTGAVSEVGLKGFGISHGIGEDFYTADKINLHAAKESRAAAGVRGERGYGPPGLERLPGRAPAEPGVAGVGEQPAGAARPVAVAEGPGPSGGAAAAPGGGAPRRGVAANPAEVRAAGGGAGPAGGAGAGSVGAATGGAGAEREPGRAAGAAGAAGTPADVAAAEQAVRDAEARFQQRFREIRDQGLKFNDPEFRERRIELKAAQDRLDALRSSAAGAPALPAPIRKLRDRVTEAQQALTQARDAYQREKTPEAAAALSDARFKLKAARSVAAEQERNWRASLPRPGEAPERAALRVARKEVRDAQQALSAAKKAGETEALAAARDRYRTARTDFQDAAVAYQRSRLPPGSVADRYATVREAGIAQARQEIDQAVEAFTAAEAAHDKAPTPETKTALDAAQARLDTAGAALRKEQRLLREGLRLSDTALQRRMEQETRDAAIRWANSEKKLGRVQREAEEGPPTVKKPVPVPPGSRLLTGKQYGPADGMIVPEHVKAALDAYLAPDRQPQWFDQVWQRVARTYKSQAMFLNFPSLIHKGKYDTVLSAGALADAGLPHDPLTMSRRLRQAAAEYQGWQRGGKMSPAIEALDKNTRAMLPDTGDLGELGSSLRNSLEAKPPNMARAAWEKARDLVPKRIGDIERTYKIMLTESLAPKYGYEEAARIAQETIGDSRMTHPLVQALERYGGVPFLTARIKALPKLARTAVTQPGILRQMSGIPFAQAMQSALPPDERQRAALLGPGAIPLPGVRDAQGRQRYVVRNPFVVTPLADIGGLGLGVGGAAGAALAAYGNVDWARTLVTGQAESITKPGEMPPLDALDARIQFVEDRLLPSFVRSGARLQRAAQGATRYGGPYQEPETLTDAVLGVATGVKLGPAETEVERKQRAQKMAGLAGRALLIANRYYQDLQSGRQAAPTFPNGFLGIPAPGQINDVRSARTAYQNAKERLRQIVTGQQYQGDRQVQAIQRQVAWIYQIQQRFFELANAQIQMSRR